MKTDPPTQTLRSCPRCRAPMSHLALPGHLTSTVVVDHCAACRLVWFDALESVELAGLGWVRLLRELQRGLGVPRASTATADTSPSAAAAADAPPLSSPLPGLQPGASSSTLPCPECGSALKPVHNLTRYGRFPALECPQRHGHLHGHAGALAERGFVRPLLAPERAALAAEKRVLHCFNCGARADGQGESCSYCASPLLVIDLPRLAHALLRRPGDDTHSPPPDGVPLAWPCHACGAALDPTRHAACPQCTHAVVAPSLVDLNPLLMVIENRLLQAEQSARPYRRKAKRPRSWQETGLGMLYRFWRADDDDARTRAQAPLLAVIVALWLVWLLFVRR